MASPKSTDSIDKLLRIASKTTEKPTKKKPPQSQIDLDQYIIANEIKAGRTKVPSYILYYHYYLWKNTRLISRTRFLSYFKTKFTKVQINGGIGYLLNPKPFNLTLEGHFRARAYFRKKRDEKKESKEKDNEKLR